MAVVSFLGFAHTQGPHEKTPAFSTPFPDARVRFNIVPLSFFFRRRIVQSCAPSRDLLIQSGLGILPLGIVRPKRFARDLGPPFSVSLFRALDMRFYYGQITTLVPLSFLLESDPCLRSARTSSSSSFNFIYERTLFFLLRVFLITLYSQSVSVSGFAWNGLNQKDHSELSAPFSSRSPSPPSFLLEEKRCIGIFFLITHMGVYLVPPLPPL